MTQRAMLKTANILSCSSSNHNCCNNILNEDEILEVDSNDEDFRNYLVTIPNQQQFRQNENRNDDTLSCSYSASSCSSSSHSRFDNFKPPRRTTPQSIEPGKVSKHAIATTLEDANPDDHLPPINLEDDDDDDDDDESSTGDTGNNQETPNRSLCEGSCHSWMTSHTPLHSTHAGILSDRTNQTTVGEDSVAPALVDFTIYRPHKHVGRIKCRVLSLRVPIPPSIDACPNSTNPLIKAADSAECIEEMPSALEGYCVRDNSIIFLEFFSGESALVENLVDSITAVCAWRIPIPSTLFHLVANNQLKLEDQFSLDRVISDASSSSITIQLPLSLCSSEHAPPLNEAEAENFLLGIFEQVQSSSNEVLLQHGPIARFSIQAHVPMSARSTNRHPTFRDSFTVRDGFRSDRFSSLGTLGTLGTPLLQPLSYRSVDYNCKDNRHRASIMSPSLYASSQLQSPVHSFSPESTPQSVKFDLLQKKQIVVSHPASSRLSKREVRLNESPLRTSPLRLSGKAEATCAALQSRATPRISVDNNQENVSTNEELVERVVHCLVQRGLVKPPAAACDLATNNLPTPAAALATTSKSNPRLRSRTIQPHHSNRIQTQARHQNRAPMRIRSKSSSVSSNSLLTSDADLQQFAIEEDPDLDQHADEEDWEPELELNNNAMANVSTRRRSSICCSKNAGGEATRKSRDDAYSSSIESIEPETLVVRGNASERSRTGVHHQPKNNNIQGTFGQTVRSPVGQAKNTNGDGLREIERLSETLTHQHQSDFSSSGGLSNRNSRNINNLDFDLRSRQIRQFSRCPGRHYKHMTSIEHRVSKIVQKELSKINHEQTKLSTFGSISSTNASSIQLSHDQIIFQKHSETLSQKQQCDKCAAPLDQSDQSTQLDQNSQYQSVTPYQSVIATPYQSVITADHTIPSNPEILAATTPSPPTPPRRVGWKEWFTSRRPFRWFFPLRDCRIFRWFATFKTWVWQILSGLFHFLWFWSQVCVILVSYNDNDFLCSVFL